MAGVEASQHALLRSKNYPEKLKISSARSSAPLCLPTGLANHRFRNARKNASVSGLRIGPSKAKFLGNESSIEIPTDERGKENSSLGSEEFCY